MTKRKPVRNIAWVAALAAAIAAAIALATSVTAAPGLTFAAEADTVANALDSQPRA